MPVSVGSPPLGGRQHEFPGRLIPQRSPCRGENPGSPACTGYGPRAAQRQAGAPGTAEHLAVARTARTL